MISLERRLLAGTALSALLVLALLWWGGGQAVRQISEDRMGQRLEQDMEALLGAVSFDAGGVPSVAANRLPAVYAQPLSGHYFQLNRGGEVLLRSRSLWDAELTNLPIEQGQRQRARQVGPSAQNLLVQAGGFRKQGQNFVLILAEDLAPLEAAVARYQGFLAWGFPLVLLLLLLLQRTVIRSALKQLDALRDDIRRVGQGETERLPEEAPLEVLPLVREFNRLLELLHQRLERSRNALGNLAHALKTPLAVLQADLEHDSGHEGAAARENLTRIRELVERELRRARIAGEGSAGRRLDPKSDLQALAATLVQVNSEKQLDLQIGAWPEKRLPPDREDMLELLGNLLDNACKWAATTVQLEFIATEPGLLIRVEDDGPGVADQDLVLLTQRGQRIDESRSGHGLGLAIAQDIAAQYDGGLRFGRSSELGGFSVEVSLPAVRSR